MPQTKERKKEYMKAYSKDYMRTYMRTYMKQKRDLNKWKQEIVKVNNEFKLKSAFPKWLYEIKQMLRHNFNKKAIRKYNWVIPNPYFL
jgi:tRNA-dihydrouridine synthase